MKKFQKMVALTAVMAMLTSPAYSQAPAYYDNNNNCGDNNCDNTCAYEDSCGASCMSWWIPVGAVAVAAIIIATTNRHHHSSSSSTCCTTSSHAHSDCGCSF